MKIALIAPGRRPIPAPNYGAIEVLIWNYKLSLEKLGHTVDIFNNIWIHETVYALNQSNYDFIHLHFDLYALYCNTYLNKPFCLTTHCGGLSKFIPGAYDYYPAFNYLFQDCLAAPGNIVLSEQIKTLFENSGYTGFLRTQRNPIEIDNFHLKKKGNGKAIYIANINARKRQALWAKKFNKNVVVDFVGPLIEEEAQDFSENETCSYLGVWDKQTIYEHLSDYSTLVLLSESEADALVVKEALAAGLSVVLNQASSANVTQEPFITILPDDEMNGQIVSQAIQQSIDNNETHRKAIRQYAQEKFSYEVLVPKYIQTIEAFISYSK